MGIPERALGFFSNTAKLQSFPVFIFYLICIFLTPVWTRLFSPFDLKQVMLIYNIVCVLLSAASTILLWWGNVAAGAMYGYDTNAYIQYGLMIYAISKNVELLDTVFMILRHRYRQISFLHVFHHSTIMILGNYAYVYTPFPPVAVVIGLNSLVHVALYSYYAITALSSTQRPSWKKNLTQFQIAQFLFDLVFAIKGYLYHGFCIYAIMYCMSMIVLFSNFYFMAYAKKKPESKKKE